MHRCKAQRKTPLADLPQNYGLGFVYTPQSMNLRDMVVLSLLESIEVLQLQRWTPGKVHQEIVEGSRSSCPGFQDVPDFDMRQCV